MRKKTLLIINSNPAYTGVTKNILEQTGYLVNCAVGFVGASEFLTDRTPDGIVLDNDDLDGIGFELCRKLRKNYDLPIMFLSSDKDDELAALQAGATDFLVRPFDHDVLKFRISIMLNTKNEKTSKQEWLTKTGRAYKAIAACLLAALIGVVIFSVIRDFNFWVDIVNGKTPLAGFEIDFYYENLDQMGADRVLNEIIVKFVDPETVPKFEKQLQHEIDKLQKIGFIEALGVYVVQAADLEKNPNAVLNRLKNNRFIEYVEPNYLLDYSVTPNDQYYSTQSKVLTTINAQAGWDYAMGKNSPIVAIIDSGIIDSHIDLPESFYNGYSAASNLSFNNDTIGHGTTVAGVVGAVGNNSVGIAGVNWNAKIMPVKVDNVMGVLNVANVAKGIIWAADNGARVINLSLGMTGDSSTMKNAIDYAYDKGCAIFAASGNSSKEAVDYPARYPNVMGVGSSIDGISRTPTSNYGAGLDVVGVGSFYSTTRTGGYSSVSGTSFASPQAASLASLMLGLNPDLTNEEIYDLIKNNAKPLGGGFNKQTGYGLIDIGKTLKYVYDTRKPDVQGPVYDAPPVITLNSFAEQELFVGDQYEEMGYTAVDCFGVDLTPYVIVSGSVDTSKAGIYTLTYTVSDNGGNTAKAARTITVKDKPLENVDEPPTLTVIGSNPIILHIDSGTPYVEQGAKAIDNDGSDISAGVEVIGQPDRNTPGSYTVTYSAIGRNGVAATVTRNVVIISPAYEKIVRTPYGFSEQGKKGAKLTRTGLVAASPGWLNLKLASIDKNMAISVQFINATTGAVAFKDSFSAAGSKQYQVGDGNYKVEITIDKANGNAKFSLNLQMPEVVIPGFDQPEVVY